MFIELLYWMLMMAIVLCALVTGLVFGFAVVVMPGIEKLSVREFLFAFKHMDEIIQNRQAAFMFVWVGSIAAVIGVVAIGMSSLSGMQLYLMWFAAGLYLLGVQLPTILFNIPLNNTLQALDIENLSDTELATARAQFEAPWNRWNRVRTLNGIVSVIALLILLSGSRF